MCYNIIKGDKSENISFFIDYDIIGNHSLNTLVCILYDSKIILSNYGLDR